MSINKLLSTSLLLSLIACGSDNNTEKDKSSTLPEITTSNVSLTALKQASAQELENHIKNGIYQKSIELPQIYTLDNVNAPASKNEASTTNNNYSATITQEAGVDEADRIKYNGNYLYIASNQYNQVFIDDINTQNEPKGNKIKILQRNEQGDLNKISETIVFEETSTIDSIYLTNDTLAVISQVYNFSPYSITTRIASDLFFPVEQKFNLSLVDVEDPATPNVSTSLTIDGAILSSRRINNIIYIVSSFTPYLPDLPYASSDEEKTANYNKVSSTNINNLLPKYTNTLGESKNLVDTNNCYLPQSTTPQNGFDGLVTLTAIDINNPNAVSSVCINAQMSGIYATSKAIYLYGTQYSESNEADFIPHSVIHKFAINPSRMDYVASGKLDGHFGWSNTNLRFSEDNEYLRVVTTAGTRNNGYTHKVNILKTTNNELTLAAQLPNEENPTIIGKLNEEGITQEDIKTVRFFNDKAYIVTFLNTDPLYVVDLSNNEKPYIAGALEIPGYSSYLHPISENLLVGIGQNIDINRITTNNETLASSVPPSPIIEGAKISLFDVSDISNPTEISSIIYEGGYTPVEFNYHALTYLKINENEQRFTLPIERWETYEKTDDTNQEKTTIWQQKNYLSLIEVLTTNGFSSLSEKGRVHPLNSNQDNINNYISSWDDRAILHNEHVYYIHGSNVWKSYWTDSKQITGPF